jgi:superfamily II DNA or RNA helicase
MAIVLNDYDPEGKAVCVSHETTKSRRKRLMDQIKSGDSLYLCNVNIATEGYDHPPTAVIVNAAPTTSRLRLAQRAGRATRTLDGVIDPFAFGTAQQRLEAIAASAKPICTFLDFTDASNDHDLAHPSEILAGHELTPEERAAMQGMLRSGRASKMADLDSMLCRAKIEAEAERLRKEDERQRLLITCEVNYRRKPLQRNKELTRNGLVRKPPNLATPKIKARLKQQGLHVESMTEDQVVAAWKDFQHRRFAKKPSMGQEKLLKELNLWHGSISRFEATRLLDQHFKNFKTNRRGNLNARAY